MFEFNYHDDKTWDLFKDGKTKGVFQLESNLGRSWSKKLKPSNIEELAALISLIRPGCLKAIVDGKSMTQHFVDRAKGLEEVEYIHESLEEILSPTYGVLVYQEQSMRIAQKLAGFNLQEADELRKAIGKKKADLMAKVRVKFIQGCADIGLVNEEEAAEIFGWIEKSSRYAFNKSHAVSYAVNSYRSAWYKANYTEEFFLSYLHYASEKQDPHQEIYELVSEAKLFDITIKISNLKRYAPKFFRADGCIYFGVRDIKSLAGVNGDKVIQAILDVEEELGRAASEFGWIDVLLFLSPKINKTGFTALCSVGFFSTKNTGVNRNKALYEYQILRQLTKSEYAWLLESHQENNYKNLKECLSALWPLKKNGGGTNRANRSSMIKDELDHIDNPPYDLDDNPEWIIEQENKFLGCPVSLSKVQASDTSHGNSTLKEIIDGKSGKNISVVANVSRLAKHKVGKGKTKGQTMAFLTIEDETCMFDNVVVFPKTWRNNQYICYEGNNLLFYGEIRDGSYIIDKIHEI